MPKRKRIPRIEGLTRKQQNACEAFLRKLIIYYATPEGREKIDSDLATAPWRKQPDPIPLTKQEERALRFIRKELKHNRQPSVRGITKAIGLRSSRSGHRIFRSLLEKGVLVKMEGRMFAKENEERTMLGI